MSDFCNTKIVKTRKEHKCGYCDSKIPKKQIVQYNDGIYDYEWFSYYLCNFCEQWINITNPDLSDGFNEDFLHNDFNQYGLTFIELDYVNKKVKFHNQNETEFIESWEDFFEIIKKELE